MTIQTMTIINLAMLSATIVITLLFGGIAAFLPTIINVIDERRYNAAKRRPALRLNAKLRRRVSNRPSKRLAAMAAAGLVTLREQATSVSQRRQQAARTYRNIIATTKHRTKRFNAPKRSKIKRYTKNPTITINRQPIASPAAPKEVKRFIARIINASNADTVYRYWKESTDDLGYNAEIYNAYKSRKAALIAA